MAKVTTLLSLFFLLAFLTVSFRNFHDFLFVKQISKAFTKFQCKNACAIGTWGILVNGAPTQILIFVKDWTKVSICHSVKQNQKSRLKSLLHMYDVYVTSCATFLMKRFFLASVYLYFRMVFAIYIICQVDNFCLVIDFCVFLFFISVVGFILFIKVHVRRFIYLS